MKTRNLLTKIVTIALFSLLILSFAVWGIGDIFRGGGQAQVVAEVGDTSISQQEYAQALSSEIATLSRRLGTQLTPAQARAFGIPQQVLSRLLSQAVLDEMANRMGMLVTQEQVDQQVVADPNFQGAGGRFDHNRFAQILRSANLSEQAYIKLIGDDVQRQQLTTAVTAAAVAPESLAAQLFDYRGERRIADYVTIANDSFTDLGEPDAPTLQATYDAASGSFMTPAYKGISLVVLSLADAAKDIAVSEDRIAQAFETRKVELSTPERRTVTQAVLPDEAAAQALADKVSEGADFVPAVVQATGRAPVDLGTITESDLPGELGAAVFVLDQGRPSAPIKSALGWHVVLVTAIEPGVEATLEGSRDLLREQLARAEAIDVVIGLANRFDDSLAGGVSLEEAAAGLNLEVRKIPDISSQARTPAGETVAGLPALNEFLQVLNRTAPGETSVLTETLEGDYFIVRVDSETPAQKKPLEAVQDEVAGMWRASERARLAEEQADALAERVKNGEDFATLAAAEKLTVQQTAAITRFENNPERTPSALLSQQLFEIAEGEVTTAATGSGQIVARLKEVLPPESAGRDEKLVQVQADLTESMQNDIFQQFLGALQQEFEVTINQRLIDQVLTEF